MELIREVIFCPEHGLIVQFGKFWPFVAASFTYVFLSLKGGR